MLHISALTTLTEGTRKHEPFSFKYVTKDGDILEGENCLITSSNNSRRTKNIQFIDSGEIRTIREVSIIEFNGKEVFI